MQSFKKKEMSFHHGFYSFENLIKILHQRKKTSFYLSFPRALKRRSVEISVFEY